ncbi:MULTISPECIES: alpha/beta hydrolase [unclassified Flavobacterium]|jgi:pectinesterase|uniref:alpha/beta hydrolase n=1 Tax=unclassified Flavobacterium TaxID=196869 RepID=UPI0025C72C1B|nr:MULTISPECIES: alpha/beta hydrolase [unclassified Flavobacterium]
MKRILVIFFIGISFAVFSQNPVERDTSYTVFSTYNKEIKKYPFIQVVSKKNKSNVVEDKGIIYKNIASRFLLLDAFYLKSDKANPAVILLHGGGWKSGDKSHMEPLAVEIASKGYSCFTVEYRLSPEAKYPAAIFDVKSAIQFIKTNAAKFNVDTSRVAVLGCSSGGQMAALVGATNGDKSFEEGNSIYKSSTNVQAVIDIDGILAFKHPQSKEGTVASLWLNGNYDENPETWQSASALTHANKHNPPILFVNSDMERFHAGRDDMILILNKFGIYNEVKRINNSPHSFWLFQPWFDQTVVYTTQFLDTIFK